MIRILEDAEIVPFLPVIASVWSDGTLRNEERQALQELATVPSVKRWMDPDNPPSPQDVDALRSRIRDVYAAQRGHTPTSLTELGIALAEADGRIVSSATRHQLLAIESRLGFVSAESVTALIGGGVGDVSPTPVASSFPRAKMVRLLDGREHATRDRIRRLLQQELTTGRFFHVGDVTKETYRTLIMQWLGVLADAGVGALAYPEETKAAADLGAFIAAFETLADFDLSLVVKAGVQFGLFGGSIYFLGSQDHRALLSDVASLALPGCFAMTELGHGSNVRALQTTATFNSSADAWIIHTPTDAAQKEYIGNAACHGRMATVFAQLITGGVCHGVHAFLVPIRDAAGQPMPGVQIADTGLKMGLNGVDNGRLRFDRVSIPRHHLLNRFADVTVSGVYSSEIASEARRFFTMLGTLVAGRISVACAANAAARTSLTIAIRYGERRRQFGPTQGPEVAILDYRTHQRRLMPRLAAAYAHTFALRWLVNRYRCRTEGDAREIETLAAGLKAVVTAWTTQTIQTCREACGGEGYRHVNRFARLKADTDVFTTFEGDNTVLLQLTARGLLSAHQDQFQEVQFVSILRHLRDRLASELEAWDPLTSRMVDPEHLRDPQMHAVTLTHREDQLLWSVAGRLRKRIRNGMDSFAAVVDCQDHLAHLAVAHVERVVSAQFASVVQAQKDPVIRAALEPLSALYSLHCIERDLAWYMENGLIEGVKARAIRKTVNALCLSVRGDARDLVDAFSIADVVLGAPIAMDA